MRKLWFYFCCLFWLLFATTFAQPLRIISLAPNITEILFAIGLGNNVVGVSAFSNYPPKAKTIPIVANAGQLDIEKIIALKPTLVIAWKGGNPQSQLLRLRHFHVPVYSFAFNQVKDIPAAMAKIGQLTQHQQQAKIAITKFKQTLDKAKKYRESDNKHPTVFYELWENPLMTIGKNTLINQAITFCGGKNIFSDLTTSAPKVSIAAIIKRNPDIIILGSNKQFWRQYWRKWQQISAVRHKKVFYVDASLLQRAGPRFANGILHLCQRIN